MKPILLFLIVLVSFSGVQAAEGPELKTYLKDFCTASVDSPSVFEFLKDFKKRFDVKTGIADELVSDFEKKCLNASTKKEFTDLLTNARILCEGECAEVDRTIAETVKADYKKKNPNKELSSQSVENSKAAKIKKLDASVGDSDNKYESKSICMEQCKEAQNFGIETLQSAGPGTSGELPVQEATPEVKSESTPKKGIGEHL